MAVTNRCPSCGDPLSAGAAEGLCPRCLLSGALANLPTSDEEGRQGTEPDQWPQIPRYRIIRWIGGGGMGDVYEAQQQQPHRTVALKVIRAGLAGQGHLRRFRYESEALGRLQHPGVAQIYESGVQEMGRGARPFFAMELVRGAEERPAPTLTDHAKARRLGTRAKLELLAEVAEAVHHAHQKGVIHRDLKPSNILVDDRGRPKVLDFGVARVTDADVQATTLHTDAGQIVGTLPYMSPEQAGGDPAEVDTRTDVYALGAVAYELLAGRPPLEVGRGGLVEAVRVIREQEPAELSTVDRTLRGDVETIVAKAVAKEKERRYASAAELAADIRRFLNDEPVSARPASARYHLAKFARRNKAVVVGAAAVLAVLLAGIATTTWQARAARRFAAESKQRQTAAEAARAAQIQATDQAKAAAAKARRLFERGHALAHSLFFERDAQVTGLPNSTVFRRWLIAAALEYLKGLEPEVRDEPAVLRTLVAAYKGLGDLQRIDLGDGKAAIESFKKAVEIHAALPAAMREEFDLLETVSFCNNGVASSLVNMGRPEEALPWFEKAEEAGRRALDAKDHGLVRHTLALTLANHGSALLVLGRHEEALALRQRALEVMSVLAEREPTPENRLKLAQHRGGIGEAQRHLQDFSGAVDSYTQSRDSIARLMEEGQRDMMTREAMVQACFGLGQSRLDWGRTQPARHAFTQALNAAQDWMALDRDNFLVCLMAPTCHERLARTWTQEDRAASLRHWRKAVGGFEDCVLNQPKAPAPWTMLTISRFELAALCLSETAVNPRLTAAQRLALAREALAQAELYAAEAPAMLEQGMPVQPDVVSSLKAAPELVAVCKSRVAALEASAGAAPKPRLRRFHVDLRGRGGTVRRTWTQVDETTWHESGQGGVRTRYTRAADDSAEVAEGIVLRREPDEREEVLLPEPLSDGAWLSARRTGEGDGQWRRVAQVQVDR